MKQTVVERIKSELLESFSLNLNPQPCLCMLPAILDSVKEHMLKSHTNLLSITYAHLNNEI